MPKLTASDPTYTVKAIIPHAAFTKVHARMLVVETQRNGDTTQLLLTKEKPSDPWCVAWNDNDREYGAAEHVARMKALNRAGKSFPNQVQQVLDELYTIHVHLTLAASKHDDS